MPNVEQAMQSAYDEQYSDKMTEWRELCARFKAQNILDVCKGRSFDRVLDCGAGEGSILKFLDGAFSEMAALEISESGVEHIRRRKLPHVNVAIKFDGYKIPFENSFDLTYCSHVLEHVEHPRILLREIARVSEFQVFEVPLDYRPSIDKHSDHFLKYGHINIYTPALVKFLLKSEGFEILGEKHSHTPMEVLSFNLYRNQGTPKTMLSELKLRAIPIWRMLNRIRYGKNYNERAFSAYTCLTRATGSLRIF